MRNEFTAIIRRDGAWFIAVCPEIPGSDGQGITKEQCLEDLARSISLILEDRREDALYGQRQSTTREVVVVEQASPSRTDTRLGKPRDTQPERKSTVSGTIIQFLRRNYFLVQLDNDQVVAAMPEELLPIGAEFKEGARIDVEVHLNKAPRMPRIVKARRVMG